MGWLRIHVRHGSRLALFALFVNLALSFGHVHALPQPNIGQAEFAAALASHDGGDQGRGDRDHHSDDHCPICIAAAAMGNAIAPTLPVLPLQFGVTLADRPVTATAAITSPKLHAFYSRGPPLS